MYIYTYINEYIDLYMYIVYIIIYSHVRFVEAKDAPEGSHEGPAGRDVEVEVGDRVDASFGAVQFELRGGGGKGGE